jgi:hypothetical protein
MATEPKPSILEQLKKIQEQRAKLDESANKIMQAATAEILAKGDAIIAELKEIGLEYHFVEGKVPVARTPNPEKECPVCGFRTDPPHDRRAHRNKKKPFAASDLLAMGLTKVT